jgi:hypothetical protein
VIGMGGMGPAPEEGRRRRNADTFDAEAVEVAAGTVVDAPELPDADAYSPATRRWYATWCAAPQAATFTVTDWQRLHMVAPLVEQYFAQPTPKLMAEIRISESELGATHLARLRGRIKVTAEQPSTASAAAAKDVADLTAERRKRLRQSGAS